MQINHIMQINNIMKYDLDDINSTIHANAIKYKLFSYCNKHPRCSEITTCMFQCVNKYIK